MIFRPKSETQRFFPPKIRCSPKKKGLYRNCDWFFVQFSKFRRLRGGCFRMGGGYFQFFTKNRPQKHKKHAILHTSRANGGARAPPGYATVHCHCLLNLYAKNQQHRGSGLLECRQRGQESKGVVFLTTLIAWSWVQPTPWSRCCVLE